jgi:hypothetical protein
LSRKAALRIRTAAAIAGVAAVIATGGYFATPARDEEQASTSGVDAHPLCANPAGTSGSPSAWCSAGRRDPDRST